MEFGIQFFPSVSEAQKDAAQYFNECLRLVDLVDPLGWSHVRIVEHYFTPYGGFSPNPLLFLAAASQRSKKARLVTGAVLPVFNHPLKLAGEIGMLDGISGGRAEIGFARAFLPDEFERFGISVNESRARFDEGVKQIRILLEDQIASHHGQFHSFDKVTSYPRPIQRPRPPFWVATAQTPESFVAAGREGYSIMMFPAASSRVAELMALYRKSWREAGHPGDGRIMIAFLVFCHQDRERAWSMARGPIARQIELLASSTEAWASLNSKDYPGYDKMAAAMRKDTPETQCANGSAMIGTPADVIEQLQSFIDRVGLFECASLNINCNDLPIEDSENSMRLLSEHVLPRFSGVVRQRVTEIG